jgi:hypothetical protein
MDLFCISPFPDGREKIQSRLKAGKEALTSHYETAIHLEIYSLFPPSKRDDTFLPFIPAFNGTGIQGKKISCISC